MLKFLKIVLPVVALMGVSAADAADAPMDNLMPIKVGVLDMQQVMQQSPQVAEINKQLQSQFQPRQQKIEVAQKNLQDEINKLNKSGTILSNNDRSKLQDKIIADRANFQAMVQSYQQDLTSAQGQATQKFMGELQAAVNDVAKQGKYNLVVQRAAVMYFDPNFNITNQVIKEIPNK